MKFPLSVHDTSIKCELDLDVYTAISSGLLFIILYTIIEIKPACLNVKGISEA